MTTSATPTRHRRATSRPGRRFSQWPIRCLATAVVLCAGCAPPGHAPPTATATAATDAWPSVPFGGAPAVTNPLPESVLAGDPCTDALTPDQVQAAIGVVVAGEREDLRQIGPACAWSNHSTGGAVGVSYTLNTHAGLSALYAGTRPASARWRVLPPVAGFPAVAHAGRKGGEVPVGFCQASVGLADRYSVDISLTLGESKRNTTDACGDPLVQISDMVITTLRAKARS